LKFSKTQILPPKHSISKNSNDISENFKNSKITTKPTIQKNKKHVSRF